MNSYWINSERKITFFKESKSLFAEKWNRPASKCVGKIVQFSQDMPLLVVVVYFSTVWLLATIFHNAEKFSYEYMAHGIQFTNVRKQFKQLFQHLFYYATLLHATCLVTLFPFFMVVCTLYMWWFFLWYMYPKHFYTVKIVALFHNAHRHTKQNPKLKNLKRVNLLIMIV